ncbi:MAG: hypothetical protein J7578_15070 [Chitinophagaceae bacterium]|nr:hypothetical protein [Chitinophagaceae bacterium]
MAINPKKASVWSLIGITSAMFLLSSCTGGPKEEGVWIPNPKDTSELSKRNHFITLDNIKTFLGDFAADRDSLKKLAPNIFIPNSETFNKKILLEILKDPNCVGLRIHHGISKDKSGRRDEFRLILTGVDKDGRDLYIDNGSAIATKAPPGGRGGAEYGQCDPPCLTGPGPQPGSN